MTLQKHDQRHPSLTVAVDGPAGAGKSTLAKIVANRLGYLYVDTGAMYRALALKALKTGIPPEDDTGLADMAANTSVRLERAPGGGNRVFLDGTDVTAEIREPQVEKVVSRVSACQPLRKYMVEAQRGIAAGGGVVMDGRDIGSHVLPNADVKFFITASLSERARRRQKQHNLAGHHNPLLELEAEIAKRDEQDRNKGEGSLVLLPEAVLIDTTGRSVEDVVEEILSHCRRE
ncbi:MAG TPA: (d)CMP kinase [Symbiobacteriaceae bacterium]